MGALKSGTASRPTWIMVVEYTSGNPETPAPYVLNVQAARELKTLEDRFSAWQALNPSALVVGPQPVSENLPPAA